jgi:hypothetical protein
VYLFCVYVYHFPKGASCDNCSMSIDFSSSLFVSMFVSIDVFRSLKIYFFLFVDLSRELNHCVFFVFVNL